MTEIGFKGEILNFVERMLKVENNPEIDFTAGELMYVWEQNLIAAASGTIERKM